MCMWMHIRNTTKIIFICLANKDVLLFLYMVHSLCFFHKVPFIFHNFIIFSSNDTFFIKSVLKFNTFRPHGVYILHGLSSHQSGAL
jgi:hypothetical protein